MDRITFAAMADTTPSRPHAGSGRRGRPPAGGREAILAAALTLLRERGIARLTTREVAEVAGVSEASVFYHYRDRAGLMQAVLEAGLEPLFALHGDGALPSGDLRATLTRLGEALERFLGQALPVMTAAQSDATMRDEMADYIGAHNLGVHRGIALLGAHLASAQEAGRIRSDVDVAPVAQMFITTLFVRAFYAQARLDVSTLPPLEATIDALVTMLSP